jgi:hypothetical protein
MVTAQIVKLLDDQKAQADRWDLTWSMIYGASAIVQTGFAVSDVNPLGPESEYTSMASFIGAGKATIAFLARTATPLRVTTVSKGQLDAAGNDCVRRNVAVNALRATARREQRSFYVSHIGGLALHGAGSAILLAHGAKREAISSFVIGYLVGVLNIYLMPRWSTKRLRKGDLSSSVGNLSFSPMVDRHGGGSLAITGSF